jgi:predicted metal-binding transcription factor (methanogenesis marker protein 9)
MLFADPTIYICPACKKPMLKTNYMSYTVHNSTAWSDGSRTGYPHFTPNLAKCPNCAAIFFLHNQWPKKEDPNEETRYYKNIADPDIADYIKAVRQGLAKDEDEEIEARTLLWRALNSNICSNDEYRELRQDNCEKLLSLNELKFNKAKPDANHKNRIEHETKFHENHKETHNLLITIAELKRNLGRFDECLKDLENLPESYNRLKEQFAEKCMAGDCRVFEIK